MALLWIWLGGFVATAAMMIGSSAADRQSLNLLDCLAVVFWPAMLVVFLIDVAGGWRP